MTNDVKSGVGFIIPAVGVVGFFTALLLGEFLLSIIISVMVILIWFLYMLVMESHVPQEMGNMIMLFGLMLSLGLFLGFGVTQNMWGGYDLKPEGAIFALIIFFFSVLTGLNFKNQQKTKVSELKPSLGFSEEDRNLVMNAINKNTNLSDTQKNEPKVIIVKQEPAVIESINKEKQQQVSELNPYDPHGVSNNPYFAYPSDYYEEDEYDDDEWEDEDEDEEYEED